jgi:hypothetical protein
MPTPEKRIEDAMVAMLGKPKKHIGRLAKISDTTILAQIAQEDFAEQRSRDTKRTLKKIIVTVMKRLVVGCRLPTPAGD